VAWRRWSTVIASVWLCASCAGPVSKLPEISAADVAAEERKQQIAQIRDYYAKLNRVDNVAFHIRVANREYCKTVSPRIGMHAVTVQSLPNKYRSFSREALNVSWTKPTVISVVAGSPAAAAGITTGDQVLMLDNVAVPPRRTAGWIGGYLKENGAQPVQVALRRNGVDQTVVVRPVIACAIPIEFVTADEVNAYTMGDKIVINTAIVALARTDAQLAVVIGHELAHVNLGHLKKQNVNALIGTIGGALVDGGFLLGGIYTGGVFTKQFKKTGALAFSVGFEREADYVGAYYAARAGYDIAGAEEIWRVLGQAHPDSIRFATTHPTSPQRFIQMREVAAEIADKKRRRLPLVPALKVSRAEPDSAATSQNSF
jgi:Zn-dependent protease with chaperone function